MTLCLLLLSILPAPGVAREAVELIELNHFYDEQGRLVFDQVIFYDWSRDDARYMVRAWRLVKQPAQLPRREHASGGYVATWSDGKLLRVIRAPSFRETWTQYDPELVEREYLPKDRRRELLPGGPRKAPAALPVASPIESPWPH
jgi:hypothetical protein